MKYLSIHRCNRIEIVDLNKLQPYLISNVVPAICNSTQYVTGRGSFRDDGSSYHAYDARTMSEYSQNAEDRTYLPEVRGFERSLISKTFQKLILSDLEKDIYLPRPFWSPKFMPSQIIAPFFT